MALIKSEYVVDSNGQRYVLTALGFDTSTGDPSYIDVTNNAAKTYTSSDSVWSYGAWPEDRYFQSSVTAPDAVDNTVFGALTDMDNYEGIIFEATAGEVTVQISLDGSTWLTTDHPFIDMGVAARTIVATTTANVGPYLMNTPCKGVRFLNDGAVQATVMYAQVGKVAV